MELVEDLPADAVDAAQALQDARGIPGDVVIDRHAGTVEVQPFTDFVRAHQDVVIVTLHGLGTREIEVRAQLVALLAPQIPHHADAPGEGLLQPPAQEGDRVREFAEDEDLAPRRGGVGVLERLAGEDVAADLDEPGGLRVALHQLEGLHLLLQALDQRDVRAQVGQEGLVVEVGVIEVVDVGLALFLAALRQFLEDGLIRLLERLRVGDVQQLGHLLPRVEELPLTQREVLGLAIHHPHILQRLREGREGTLEAPHQHPPHILKDVPLRGAADLLLGKEIPLRLIHRPRPTRRQPAELLGDDAVVKGVLRVVQRKEGPPRVAHPRERRQALAVDGVLQQVQTVPADGHLLQQLAHLPQRLLVAGLDHLQRRLPPPQVQRLRPVHARRHQRPHIEGRLGQLIRPQRPRLTQRILTILQPPPKPLQVTPQVAAVDHRVVQQGQEEPQQRRQVVQPVVQRRRRQQQHAPPPADGLQVGILLALGVAETVRLVHDYHLEARILLQELLRLSQVPAGEHRPPRRPQPKGLPIPLPVLDQPGRAQNQPRVPKVRGRRHQHRDDALAQPHHVRH